MWLILLTQPANLASPVIDFFGEKVMGAQTKKDTWDKAKILGELLTSIVGGIILVTIPIVISIGADKISRSLQTGQLVDSLIEDLTQEKELTRRDIALIALDEAVSTKQQCRFLVWGDCHPDETQPDQVAEIAKVLLKQEIQDSFLEEGTVDRASVKASEVIPILIRRRPQEWKEDSDTQVDMLITAALDANSRQKARSEADPTASPSRERAAQVQQASAVIGSIQASAAEAKPSTDTVGGVDAAPEPPEFLEDVHLVYIQYEQRKDAAESLREVLQSRGKSVPDVEQVAGIPGNSIRYAGDGARDAAKELQSFLSREGITISDDNLIDLSPNYQVSPGQFEIWLAE